MNWCAQTTIERLHNVSECPLLAADIPFALLNVHYSLNSDQKSRLRDS